MSEKAEICPRCGSAIQAEAPQGLCPKCLLAAVSLPTETGTGAPAGKFAVPPVAELAAVFPHLEILELIGQGGMGVVFKARQPKLDRLVALKILPTALAADAAFAERFTREGRVLARLNHPNIVTVHDFGQANGYFYLLMEFVDGANLRQAMKAGRFTPDQALAVVPKVCDALQYAHNEGILHRDIKPENILLDAKGRVKIADFGIAKLVGEPLAEKSLTASGARLGTPHYMAPEQIEKPSDVDHRADIYSLGVVFYEMLTGELPLGRFAKPSEKSTSDPRLDAVVFRTLEKEPGRRTQSASEVKTQVENITSHAPPRPASSTNQPKVGNSYLTTPEHLATLAGQFKIYLAKGFLRLDKTQLSFSHAAHNVTIPLHAIRDLSIGHYPWAMKPSRLDFICVTFEENGQSRRVLFTPHESAWMPTWNTNEVVAEWYTAVRDAIVASTGRAPTSTPATQLNLPEPPPLLRVAFGALVIVPFMIVLAVWFHLTTSSGNDTPTVKHLAPFAVIVAPVLVILLALGWSRKRHAAPAGHRTSGLLPALLIFAVLAATIALVWALLNVPKPQPPAPPIPQPVAPKQVGVPPPQLLPAPANSAQLEGARDNAQAAYLKTTPAEVYERIQTGSSRAAVEALIGGPMQGPRTPGEPVWYLYPRVTIETAGNPAPQRWHMGITYDRNDRVTAKEWNTNGPWSRIDWQPWDAQTLTAMRQGKKPVLVSFEAEWDGTSLQNRASALDTAATSRKLKELGALAQRGNFTAANEAIASELKKFGRAGVPLVLVYPSDPTKPPIVLPPVLTQEAVLAALEKAKE
jgi:serine/threonine protein kinase